MHKGYEDFAKPRGVSIEMLRQEFELIEPAKGMTMHLVKQILADRLCTIHSPQVCNIAQSRSTPKGLFGNNTIWIREEPQS